MSSFIQSSRFSQSSHIWTKPPKQQKQNPNSNHTDQVRFVVKDDAYKRDLDSAWETKLAVYKVWSIYQDLGLHTISNNNNWDAWKRKVCSKTRIIKEEKALHPLADYKAQHKA